MNAAADGSIADVATAFIEQMGLLTEDVGMPRIAGRIMGLLLIDETPVDLVGIADRLQVSHGSVSTNTRLLESLGVIERVTVPGDRRVRFRLGVDPAGQFLERELQRQYRLGALVRSTLDALPPEASGRANLEKMLAFHAIKIRRSSEMLAEWVAHLGAQDRRTSRTMRGMPETPGPTQ